MNKLILALLLAVPALPASTILYQNTTTDTGYTISYSATGFVEMGDQVQLTAPGQLDTVQVQFFNGGSDATFDAVLRFYAVGSPVGSSLGGPFTVVGVSMLSGTSQNVSFTGLGVAVPQDLILTFAVQNVSAGGDVGLNLFDPPTAGNSSSGYFIASDGTDFSQATTGLNVDNPYLQVSGTATPEPSTALMVLGGVLMAVWRRGRGRRCLRSPRQ